MTTDSPRGLRRFLSRFVSNTEVLDAERLQKATFDCGALPCNKLPDRTRVTVAGTLRNVTVRPRAGVPALEAEIYDGSGSVVLTFLGRRRIPGIEPGRSLIAHGLVTESAGHRMIYNPRYELRPEGQE
jgi:hypothetical protein